MGDTRESRLKSVTGVAEQLDCSRGHVYGLIASGQLRAVEIKTKGSSRSKTRVRAEDVEAFIASHTRSTA